MRSTGAGVGLFAYSQTLESLLFVGLTYRSASRTGRRRRWDVDPLGAALPETSLHQELSAVRDQLAATAEILRIVSRSPHDVQPVFEAIAESTARLCGAEFAAVYRFDGKLIHFVAQHGL